MKKAFWKVTALLALVMSVVTLTLLFSAAGTTFLRFVLVVASAFAIIITMILMPKKVAPAASSPAATSVTQDDVLNTLKALSHYYSARSASVAEESAYLQATDGLSDALKKATALYVQSKDKRIAAEQRAIQLNKLLNGNGQNNP